MKNYEKLRKIIKKQETQEKTVEKIKKNEEKNKQEKAKKTQGKLGKNQEKPRTTKNKTKVICADLLDFVCN